jgi:hypothetical protein
MIANEKINPPIMACCMAITLNSTYAQNSNEKKHHYLRDYKAPDFKQQRFDITLNMSGGSQSNYTTADLGRFGGVNMLSYNQYLNMQNYQGRFSAMHQGYTNWTMTDSIEAFYASNEFSVGTENRFYLKPKWFFGV